ncbi:MAG TPA: response regulator [Polyangiaceae bacterium]|jgi:signal transduction histidine kinase/ActR/RegA family two-component response regulator
MSYPFVLAVCGATLGAFFVPSSLMAARAPGWQGLRWFAVITGTAGCFCAGSAIMLTNPDDGTAVVLARVCTSLALVNTFAWLRYSAVAPPRPFGRALEYLVLAVAALVLVPGACYSTEVVRRQDWLTDNVYVLPTSLGLIAVGVAFAISALPLARYVARWRAKEPGAGAHLLALATLIASCAFDVVDRSWMRLSPRVLPIGFIVAVVAVGWTLMRRFVGASRELEAVSARLAATVAERNGELARAQESLAHNEKFAVLGRLSGAVAHEINNPAAAVAANLGYMRDVLRSDGTGLEDAAEIIKETLESVERIARIVQQLGDAGELALRGGASTAVSVAETVRRAAADAHAELGEGITMSLDVPETLFVQTQEGSLRQVVTGLVVTAARAMREAHCSGRILVGAVREGDRVVVRVVDPCPEHDGARRFDPFVSARPISVARGVGLSVAVVLLRVFGGEMALERADERGSVVRVGLQAAEAPAQRNEVADSSRSPRARVLLVDDDVLVRIGLRRLLGREYVIDEAGSVEEAMALVRAHVDEIDAIVCDLVMPDGGGGQLLDDVERLEPRLARATVLMTGGAVDEATQAVLDANAERVLRKPVDVASLRALIEQVRRRRPADGMAKPRSG